MEVVGEESFKVGGARGQDDLMSVDLFAFDDESDIAEFWFVEDADEVLLFIGLKAQIDIATCLSKVFWILLDGA